MNSLPDAPTISPVMLQPTRLGFLKSLRERAFARVDIASLVFFRIAFGLLMAWQAWHYFHLGLVRLFWVAPHFMFKFPGFSWVQPWPGNGPYVHVAVLGVLGLFIAAGFLYRLSTTLFFLGWTYLFLLDEALWRDHTYLIALFSFLLILVPANRAVAVDSWMRPRIRIQTTPAWTIWILRFQMGVVYFFAAIARVSPDWFHAVPTRAMLIMSNQPPPFDRFLTQPPVYYAFAYAELLFDLTIVLFLLWRRTRVPAFCTAVTFHLITWYLFPLEIFPWLAIIATTLFLSPDWPRRCISRFRKTAPSPPAEEVAPPAVWKQQLILRGLAIYAAIQCLVPLRLYLDHGGVEWSYAEHRLSWRMMIQNVVGQCYFYVTDPNSTRTARINAFEKLPPWQAKELLHRPDMMVQFAKILAEKFPPLGKKPVRVEARITVSLNGRRPQLLIDPNVDLAHEDIPIVRPKWLREIHEPLPNPLPDPREDIFGLK